MKVNEHEMRGLLTGKCVAADMLVNKELPDYLVRKFSELHKRLDEKERLLDGVPQEAIDGGWTAKGLSDYAKCLEGKLLPSPSVQDGDLKALLRFNETFEDGEGYDISDEAMNRLVELGMVAKERAGMRVITSFGMWVIARERGETVMVLETQRDRDLAFQRKIAQLRAGSNEGGV